MADPAIARVIWREPGGRLTRPVPAARSARRRGTWRPGRNIAATRSRSSKLRYQAYRFSTSGRGACAYRRRSTRSGAGISERLEVRDLRRPEGPFHRRREPEEQLGRRRHAIRPGDPRTEGHLVREARRPPPKPPPTKPFRTLVIQSIPADRRATSLASSIASRDRRYAAARRRRYPRASSVRITREPLGVLEHAEPADRDAARTSVDGELPLRLRRDQPPEVRQAPRDRDRRAASAPPRLPQAHARTPRALSRSAAGAWATRSRAVTTRWWSGGTRSSTPSVDDRLRVRQEMLRASTGGCAARSCGSDVPSSRSTRASIPMPPSVATTAPSKRRLRVSFMSARRARLARARLDHAHRDEAEIAAVPDVELHGRARLFDLRPHGSRRVQQARRPSARRVHREDVPPGRPARAIPYWRIDGRRVQGTLRRCASSGRQRTS